MNLLELVMSASARRMLNKDEPEQQATGMLGPAPSRPRTLLDLKPEEAPAPQPQPTPGPQMAPPIDPGAVAKMFGQAPGPPQPSPEQVQAYQTGAGTAARLIAKTTGGDIPEAAERWIDELGRVSAQGDKPGVWDRLLGANVPGLNANQRAQLRSDALITAGLSMMGRTGVTFGEVLGGGLLIARQQSAKSAEAMQTEMASQQYLMQLAGALDGSGTPLERWQQVRKMAATAGNLEAVRVANDVIKEIKNVPAAQGSRRAQVVGGELRWVDEAEGKIYLEDNRTEVTPEMLAEERAQQIAQAESQGAFRETVIGQDGKPRIVLFSRDGQPMADLGEAPARSTGGGGASGPKPEDLRTAATLDREVATMDEILAGRDYKPFGRFGQAAQSQGVREVLSAEQQNFQAAAENILSIIVKARSGAQATEAEVDRLRSFAVPMAGDDPATVRAKLDRLRRMVDDLRGGAAPAPATPSVDLDAADAILGGN